MPENPLVGKVNAFLLRADKLQEEVDGFFTAKAAKNDNERMKDLLIRYGTLLEEAAELPGKLLEQNEALVGYIQHLVREKADGKTQNEKLVQMLEQAKQRIVSLSEEVEKLSTPPNYYGMFSSVHEDGTVNIYTGGRKMRVNLHPSIRAEELRKGQELILNEALNAVAVAGFEMRGEVVAVKSRLDDARVLIVIDHDREQVAEIGGGLAGVPLKAGELLLFDARSGFVLEKLPKSDTEALFLEEVPSIGYEAIGGLGPQIEMIRDAIELPHLYADYFREHRLQPPKGVLLYGPPGCGKTLIAKAVAHSLAEQLAKKIGQAVKGYFLNIKGPELLNKYVGETERQIREIFSRAKEKSSEDSPVVIFFDEMDSLFRTRGSGISSDVESTIVPQFLAELDGIEGLKNVIVIGATNRQDLIDPAVLRPGRFDVKIKIDRPDQNAAYEIFSKYLTPDLPFAAAEISFYGTVEKMVAVMIAAAIQLMYAAVPEHRFLEVTYVSGQQETLYFKDFVSGAMIESICTRAKKRAVKRMIATAVKGLTVEDLLDAVRAEFMENEDLPNTTNPDDWAKIAGRRSERIVNVRTVFDRESSKSRQVKDVSTGHYL